MTPRTDSCFLDSLTVTSFFGSAEMRAIFNDRSLMQAWLDVEGALARAQAGLGLIPREAATTISRSARIEQLDMAGIAAAASATAHPLVPLIRALVDRCGPSAGGFVHLGATTQDVMDTGFVLRIRDGLVVLERQTAELCRALRTLAIRHRGTPMAGRTHGQQALPTTFGLRVAGWYDEMRRHGSRLREMKPRLLVGSFGGAVGTLAGYGPKALELRDAFMRELGLGVPATSWHANQDRFAECIALLGMLASTAEKIAREVYLLGRTEIGEASEPQGAKQVGSSTMPHKQNPIRSEAIIGAAATLRAQVPLGLAAMVAQDDRDMGTGMVLWKLVPEAFILIGGIFERLNQVVGDLRVDTARMAANLRLSGGLIVSEAVMLELARSLGREEAHHVVTDAARRSVEQRRPFSTCLREHPALAGRLSTSELDALLDPDAYLGQAGEIVDRVLLQGEA
jgi:adenylosuccinate lyase/3-carboxy-cis,cis-muconate cycloisomerase